MVDTPANRFQNSLIRRSTCIPRLSPDPCGLALVGCYDESQVTGGQRVDAPTTTKREDGAWSHSLTTSAHEEALRALWTAYLEEGALPLREAGYEEDVPAVVAADLAAIGQFRPPDGRLLLAVDGGEAVGCGALRVIAPGIAESSGCTCDRRPEGGASAGRYWMSSWPRPAASGAVRRGWTRGGS